LSRTSTTQNDQLNKKVNVPPKGFKKIIDLCGSKTGRKVDKIKKLGLKVQPSKAVKSPTLSDCPVTLECKVMFKKRIAKRDVPINMRKISDAAKDAGIQKACTRRTGDEWHVVHAHVFRRYWVARMDDAKVTNNYLIDYQLGHLIPAETYYEGMFTDEKIVEAIIQADKWLRVLPS
jgi:integrase